MFGVLVVHCLRGGSPYLGFKVKGGGIGLFLISLGHEVPVFVRGRFGDVNFLKGRNVKLFRLYYTYNRIQKDAKS